MKIMWLGQAGYRLRSENGLTILIDPYLSDSLRNEKGESFKRQIPINGEVLNHVDVLILTHLHGDHTDMETIDQIIEKNGKIAILAPLNVLDVLRRRYEKNPQDYMLFDRDIEITLKGVRFISTYAAHSDERPIGVTIEGDGKVICHTGDTMYHKKLLMDLPRGADALLLPINGQGYNMNAVDAARLTRMLEPKTVYPMHWDMFKEYGCNVSEFIAAFDEKERGIIRIPDHYREYML